MGKRGIDYNPLAVRAVRKAKNVSQYGLSRSSGVPEGTIASLEKGHRPTVEEDTLTAIAKALEVPVETFTNRLPEGYQRCECCAGRGWLDVRQVAA